MSALLILVLLGSGLRSGLTLDAGSKAAILQVHIPVAILVLILTLFRLFWWWRFDTKPKPLGNSPAWQKAIATWTHRLLYVLLLAMLGSGISLSILSGAPDAVFGSAPMPEFETFAPRIAHGIIARLLIGLIALHAGAAQFHHFLKHDTTLRRIWFTKTG